MAAGQAEGRRAPRSASSSSSAAASPAAAEGGAPRPLGGAAARGGAGARAGDGSSTAAKPAAAGGAAGNRLDRRRRSRRRRRSLRRRTRRSPPRRSATARAATATSGHRRARDTAAALLGDAKAVAFGDCSSQWRRRTWPPPDDNHVRTRKVAVVLARGDPVVKRSAVNASLEAGGWLPCADFCARPKVERPGNPARGQTPFFLASSHVLDEQGAARAPHPSGGGEVVATVSRASHTVGYAAPRAGGRRSRAEEWVLDRVEGKREGEPAPSRSPRSMASATSPRSAGRMATCSDEY